MSVLILNHAEVHASLPPQECERAMASVLTAHARGGAYFPLRSVMLAPGAAVSGAHEGERWWQSIGPRGIHDDLSASVL